MPSFFTIIPVVLCMIFRNKIKTRFEKSFEGDIWRILLSENHLLLEIRNQDKKDVSFSVADTDRYEIVSEDIRLDEKFWIGVEEFSFPYIVFHGFTKPDMPFHKGLYVYEISSKKIIHGNDDLVFRFMINDRIYCYKQLFESQHFYALSLMTGEILEDIGTDNAHINKLLDDSRAAEDYSLYRFPVIAKDEREYEIVNLITGNIPGVAPLLPEFIEYRHYIIFSYNVLKNQKSDIYLCIYNTQKKKVLRNELINKDLSKPLHDSFFMFKNILYVIRNRKTIILTEIEDE